MPKIRSLKDRFEEKFDILENGCWQWNAGHHQRGYGHIHVYGQNSGRRMFFAHRVSMHLYKGLDLNFEGHACHTCDNPACVNPDHLFIGDHKANMRDMVAKGRHISPTRKMSDSDIELAVFMREEGAMVKSIATHFKMDSGHMSRLLRKHA